MGERRVASCVVPWKRFAGRNAVEITGHPRRHGSLRPHRRLCCHWVPAIDFAVGRKQRGRDCLLPDYGVITECAGIQFYPALGVRRRSTNVWYVISSWPCRGRTPDSWHRGTPRSISHKARTRASAWIRSRLPWPCSCCFPRRVRGHHRPVSAFWCGQDGLFRAVMQSAKTGGLSCGVSITSGRTTPLRPAEFICYCGTIVISVHARTGRLVPIPSATVAVAMSSSNGGRRLVGTAMAIGLVETTEPLLP